MSALEQGARVGQDDLWCTKKEFTLLVMTCAPVHAATDTCNCGFPGPLPARGCL